MSYQEQMDAAFPSQNWWTTGPQVRGLVSDGAGGYLCQVLWYRDVDVSLFWAEDRPLPEDGEPWPVEYLCHTVWVRPDGGYWTVTPLAETRGELESVPVRSGGDQFPGAVTWVGELDGIQVSLSPVQLLETGEGMLGLEALRDWKGRSGWSWDTGGDQPDPHAPRPGSQFYSVYTGVLCAVTNTGGEECTLVLQAKPLWEGSHGLDSGEPGDHMAADALTLDLTLEPGEARTYLEGDGGASGALGSDLPYFLGPDAFRVTLTLEGEEHVLTLKRTYTTPDGGSYTLPGEEERP